jgi:hypothetical protein
MRILASLAMLLLIGMSLVACGDDGDDGAPAPTSTEEAEATSTTVPPSASPTEPSDGAFSLPESPLSATLDQPYQYQDDQPLTPAPEDYPFPAGSVTAHWYQSEGVFVVYFEGFPADGPLCPGASILTDTGFQGVANGPAAPGACEGIDTLKPPPTGVHRCDGLVLFRTEVAVGLEGDLYASTNRNLADGSSSGMLGFIASSAGEAPEVDLSACTPPPEL